MSNQSALVTYQRLKYTTQWKYQVNTEKRFLHFHLSQSKYSLHYAWLLSFCCIQYILAYAVSFSLHRKIPLYTYQPHQIQRAWVKNNTWATFKLPRELCYKFTQTISAYRQNLTVKLFSERKLTKIKARYQDKNLQFTERCSPGMILLRVLVR